MDWHYVIPCFLLGRFNTDPATGDVLLDDAFEILTPEDSDGARHIAIFTDRDGAEEFRDDSSHTDLRFLEIPTRPTLISLLLFLKASDYQWVAWDVRPGSIKIIGAAIDSVLLSLATHHLQDSGFQP